MTPPRYRWVVLAVGAFCAASFSMLRMGLPALAPALRDTFGLTLAQVGLVFSALVLGVTATLLPWGALADRAGERVVLTTGLAGFAVAVVLTAFAPGYHTLLAGMAAAGAFGAATTGASGRAVMGWFPRSERGLALGLRQMALPLGGAAASFALPPLAGASGLRAALLVVAGVALTAAATAALMMRDAPPPPASAPAPQVERPTRDPRQWRLGAASALLVVGQSAMLGFLVLFLHDARGVPVATAAAALATLQLLGAGARVIAGRRSDREGARIPLLRRIAAADAVLLGGVAALSGAGSWADPVLFPLLLVAGVTAMCWNGLAFTAAAEIAGRRRAGTAMSLQNTVVSIGGTLAPTAFGALVGAASWPVAYAAIAAAPLLALAVLAPLEADERCRAEARTRRLAIASGA
ncbi:MAG TPA: MFS transporter [Baekduia sp.]|nr:MFS transporter [Baekduia sp.]